VPLAGRTLIVTDDGVATGATLRAALAALRKEAPRRLVVALPGGAGETLEDIRGTPGVDEVVVLSVPAVFFAVGQLYDSFDAVSSEEVCAVLRRFRARRRERAQARASPAPSSSV
jgi:predicted phosphoribosyltransferase